MSAGLIAAIWDDKNTVIAFLLDSDSNDDTILMMMIISASGHFGYHDSLAVPAGVIYIYIWMYYLINYYDVMMMIVQWLSCCSPQDNLCLYLYALFDINILRWHGADGCHDCLAFPLQR